MINRQKEQEKEGVNLPSAISVEQMQILQFQKQLHEQGQERFRAIEERLGKQDEIQIEHGKVLATIAANTSDLPQLKEEIEDIQNERSKAKGAVKLAMALGTGSGVIEAVRWFFARH